MSVRYLEGVEGEKELAYVLAGLVYEDTTDVDASVRVLTHVPGSHVRVVQP